MRRRHRPPQGGVISPLLCNIYLDRLGRAWQTRHQGRLVRYAADRVAMRATLRQVESALATLTAMLAELGLAPKTSKTRIVHLKEGGGGFDFLGFHHGWVRACSQQHRHMLFLARHPSEKAMRQIRDRGMLTRPTQRP